MSEHIKNDDLIRYQFDLTTPEDATVIARHLETCELCRAKVQKIEAKFAQLDILQDDMKISSELLEKTARQVQTKPKNKSSLRLLWPAAAAAALVMGATVMFSDMLQPKAETSKNKKISLSTPASSLTAEIALADAKEMAAIDEKPPFAPASAIELNVLPRRDNLQLTIYNSADLTLVREQRKLTIKRGWNWLQFMWANTLIDPTSLTLEPLENKDKFEVQQLVYPAGLKDIGRWLIRSEVGGQIPVEITYMTSGISWRAFYQSTLSTDESKMHLEGYVRVDNQSGEDYENAQTRLIVGEVHQLETITELAKRQWAYGSSVGWFEISGLLNTNGDSPPVDKFDFAYNGLDIEQKHSEYSLGDLKRDKKVVAKEGLSEYFLYTIEGTETIENQWAKRLPSFEAADIPVENLYKYDEERWGSGVVRFLSFTNDMEHKLGTTPIPDGSVEVYRGLTDGKLSYTGGTSFKYIPVNEKVELDLGPAENVKIEPVLMKQETENYQFDNDGNISGNDQIETWKVTVTNTRDIPVKIEIYRNFDTTYWAIVNTGQFGEYEKEDVDTAKYTLNLNPASKAEFEYKLTKYIGTRQQTYK